LLVVALLNRYVISISSSAAITEEVRLVHKFVDGRCFEILAVLQLLLILVWLFCRADEQRVRVLEQSAGVVPIAVRVVPILLSRALKMATRVLPHRSITALIVIFVVVCLAIVVFGCYEDDCVRIIRRHLLHNLQASHRVLLLDVRLFFEQVEALRCRTTWAVKQVRSRLVLIKAAHLPNLGGLLVFVGGLG